MPFLPLRPAPLAWLMLWISIGTAGATVQEGAPVRSPERTAPPPFARVGLRDSLLADRAARRGPADGVGKAWLVPEESDLEVQAGSVGRWSFVFEAAEPGISPRGVLFFQVSPFWGWSSPQTTDPGAPGYTEVQCEVEGARFQTAVSDQQQLAIRFLERGLRAGERLRIVYHGNADRFAEAHSRFWFWVDGDGDGVRGLVPDSPSVRVLPGPAALLVATLPSTAEPGAVLPLTLALLDARGNDGVAERGDFSFALPEGVELVGGVPIERGLGRAHLRFPHPGVYRIRVGYGTLEAESNPVVVRQGVPKLLWGDLHSHSAVSDGSGDPDDLFRYARDAAGLDFAAVTDHDHWGMPFLDASPESWRAAEETVHRWNDPGRFSAFLGYEWTNWIHGHRQVIYGGDRGPLLSSLDPATDTPSELWAALRGHDALTIAHHSAGDPMPTDWRIPPDPAMEPVTEIVSVHGSSESADGPGTIAGFVPGNGVRDALRRGYRLGLIGSGDEHDGHPGLARLAGPSGGLVAVFAPENTRAAILAALRARRCYATNGPRIILRFQLGGVNMGGTLPPGPAPSSLPLVCRVVGTAALDRVDLIYGGQVADTIPAGGRREFFFHAEVPPLPPGAWVYLRVIQQDGGTAWSSPIWAAAEEAGVRDQSKDSSSEK